MERATRARIAIVLLVIAVIGIIFLNLVPGKNLQITLQAMAIIFLAILSVGLFFENNKTNIASFYRKPLLEYAGLFLLFIFGLGLIAIEIISWISGGGFYFVPLFMAALAIGLFLANRAINQ